MVNQKCIMVINLYKYPFCCYNKLSISTDRRYIHVVNKACLSRHKLLSIFSSFFVSPEVVLTSLIVATALISINIKHQQ